jgi:hypothetical protein
MRKRVLSVSVFVALAIFVVSLRGFGDEHPWNTWNYPTQLNAGAVVSGEVTNVDPVNRLIQVRDAVGLIQTIHVTDSVRIVRQGKTVEFSDVDLGDTLAFTQK